jgi:hypothetical protein
MQIAATGAAQPSATCPLCHIILAEASSETMHDLGAAVNSAVNRAPTRSRVTVKHGQFAADLVRY